MMDAEAKLQILATEMRLEPAEETSAIGVRPPAEGRSPDAAGPCGHSPAEIRAAVALNSKKSSLGVFHAAMPGGKTLPMLKTMLTSACERDCYYCPFRAGRNSRRATFKPHEMAKVFSQMNRGGAVQGLFLSSGLIKGGVQTQDRLIDTVEILRRQHDYRGYVHLKIMPGAEKDQVLRAMQLADRISVNLEAPNARRLPLLAPHKIFFEELLAPLQWADEIRRALPPAQGWKGRWPSLVTQFVVGAAGESDLEILSTTWYLIRQLRLARVYFSAFNPILDTPLENLPPENPAREHRLYQSSFLMRDYGFELEDMPFTQAGNLPLDIDPKLAWARMHLAETPMEINRADKRALLRVPGIGPKAAEAILAARRQGTVAELRDLHALGAAASRAAPFILLNGKRPGHQLSLFV